MQRLVYSNKDLEAALAGMKSQDKTEESAQKKQKQT